MGTYPCQVSVRSAMAPILSDRSELYPSQLSKTLGGQKNHFSLTVVLSAHLVIYSLSLGVFD
jgi:hypothetical protein